MIRISKLAKNLGVTRQAVEAAIKRVGVTPKKDPELGWNVLSAGQVLAVRRAMRTSVKPGPKPNGGKK